MQLTEECWQNSTRTACSTLRRVEPNATYKRHSRTSPKSNLAVPSDGSNLMQQLQRCHDHPGLRRLAVPSDGSNLMQLATTVSFPCVPPVLQYPLTGRT